MMFAQRPDAYQYGTRAPRRAAVLAPGLVVSTMLLCLALATPSAAQQPAAAVDHSQHSSEQHAAYMQASQAPQPSDAAHEHGSTSEEIEPAPADASNQPVAEPAAASEEAAVQAAAEMEPVTWPWIPSCGGNTVPFEAQGWWMNDFGHVHVGFCAPQNQTIRGQYTLDVYPVLFHNPGKLTLIQAQIDSSSTSVGGDYKKIDMTCPITQICTQKHQLTIDANDFPNSGWHHLRIRAVVKEPDGKELVVSNFVPVYLDNGKPRKDYTNGMVINGTTDYVAGRGWYTNAGYVWSVIFDPPTADKRLSGIYTFKVRPMATSNPKPISYFVAKLDATHTDPGRVVYESRNGRTDIVDIPVDTRQLTNGWHSLIVRTEAAGYSGGSCAQFCSGSNQTHAGDSKIWFYVDNSGGQSSTPVPTATTAPQPTSQPNPTAQPTSQPNPTAQPTSRPNPTAPAAGMESVTWPWVPGCSGNTVPFEAQGWWMNDFGHVHVGFCAPQNQTIRGQYTFDVYPVLFHNPGKLTLIQAQIDSSSTSVGGDYKKIDMTCPITQTCIQKHQLTIDAREYPNSGWHHLRIRAVVKEPDGKDLVATNFVPVYLDNGKPRKDWTSGMVISGTTDYLAGRGWYTGAEYVWSVFFDPPTASKRISGTHTFRVRPMATNNPKPISYFVVKLDATHTDPGKLLYEHRTTSTNIVEVKLDTRQLADGWHSIIARTESAGQSGASCAQFCSGAQQTHAGDGKIWFYVDN